MNSGKDGPDHWAGHRDLGELEGYGAGVAHDAGAHLDQIVPQAVQCLMCRPIRPKALREVIEVLLVNRFQRHQYRSLQDLVLKGRYPDRAGLAPVSLRNLPSSHWRCEDVRREPERAAGLPTGRDRPGACGITTLTVGAVRVTPRWPAHAAGDVESHCGSGLRGPLPGPESASDPPLPGHLRTPSL